MSNQAEHIETLRIARDNAKTAYDRLPRSPYLKMQYEKKQKALDKALFAQLKQNKQTAPIFQPVQQNLF